MPGWRALRIRRSVRGSSPTCASPRKARRTSTCMAGAPGSPLVHRLQGSDASKPLTGKTLAEVMAMRGTSAEDTIIDLVIEDHSRVDTVYFLMSEENVRLGIAQPWVSFGSDAQASAPEGVFLKSSNHPRAYGNFARLLGKYVREEQIISLRRGDQASDEVAGHQLETHRSWLHRSGLLCRRGRVRPGDDHRPRDLRRTAALRHRRVARARQRRQGPGERRTHRGASRARRPGAGLGRQDDRLSRSDGSTRPGLKRTQAGFGGTSSNSWGDVAGGQAASAARHRRSPRTVRASPRVKRR